MGDFTRNTLNGIGLMTPGQRAMDSRVRQLEGDVQGPPELVRQEGSFRHLRYPGGTETYQSGGFDEYKFVKGEVFGNDGTRVPYNRIGKGLTPINPENDGSKRIIERLR